jgi:hypothetical protein
MNFLIQKVLAEPPAGMLGPLNSSTSGTSADFTGETFSIKPPIGIPDNVCTLINNVTNFIIDASIPIAGLMILYGAFLILTAAESPKRFEAGKKTILYTILGLVIIILTKGLIVIITQLIGASGKGLCS